MTAAVWAGALVWLIGWALGARMALVYLMGRPTCSSAVDRRAYVETCRNRHEATCVKPTGQVRERTVVDGVQALGIGLLWPVIVPVVGASLLVTRAVPLTAGEERRASADMERRLAEQSAEIDRLHREIGASVMQRKPDEMGWRYPA